VTINEAFITLLIALVPATITYLLGRRRAQAEPEKMRADAAKTLTNGYGALVDDLREQVDGLQVQVTELAAESIAQGMEIDSLRGDLARAQVRIFELEQENRRLRQSNYNLGVAAEQLRAQVLGRKTKELPEGTITP